MTIEDHNRIILDLELAENAIEDAIDNLRKGILDGVALKYALDKVVEAKEKIANDEQTGCGCPP